MYCHIQLHYYPCVRHFMSSVNAITVHTGKNFSRHESHLPPPTLTYMKRWTNDLRGVGGVWLQTEAVGEVLPRKRVAWRELSECAGFLCSILQQFVVVLNKRLGFKSEENVWIWWSWSLLQRQLRRRRKRWGWRDRETQSDQKALSGVPETVQGGHWSHRLHLQIQVQEENQERGNMLCQKCFNTWDLAFLHCSVKAQV